MKLRIQINQRRAIIYTRNFLTVVTEVVHEDDFVKKVVWGSVEDAGDRA